MTATSNINTETSLKTIYCALQEIKNRICTVDCLHIKSRPYSSITLANFSFMCCSRSSYFLLTFSSPSSGSSNFMLLS
jgi:hypothetical protein